jgi:SAM-dependent methyltransferase
MRRALAADRSIQLTMSVRSKLGRLKRGLKNWLSEWRHGPDTRFSYNLRDLEDYMRVSFCSVREVGLQTRCMISERIVEYPLVFQKITRTHGRILDIGSSESFLPYQLASLGHQVVASDLLPPTQHWRKRTQQGRWELKEDQGGYLFRHPTLHFVREDATRLGHPDITFDYVTAISTVEHFGCYGVRQPDPTHVGKQAMKEMHRVLKADGTLLMSVPYGTGSDSPRNWLLQLVFNESLLAQYLERFTIVELLFFTYRQNHWHKCERAEAEQADCSTRTTGMCFVEARKSRL